MFSIVNYKTLITYGLANLVKYRTNNLIRPL